jgi:hypothetical protein
MGYCVWKIGAVIHYAPHVSNDEAAHTSTMVDIIIPRRVQETEEWALLSNLLCFQGMY